MRNLMFASVMMSLFLAPGLVQAQIKLPIYEEDPVQLQKVVFQEANQRTDFQHGKFIRVTLNRDGDKVIKGVLVRVERQTGRIFLRTEPGLPPIAIAEKDIKRIDKGVIKEASFKQDVLMPEIRPIVIYNGKTRTTSYSAPTLSPGERSRLIELEAAENDMARLELMSERQVQVLNTEMAIQAKQYRTLELYNELLWKQPAQYTSSSNSFFNGILPILNTGSSQLSSQNSSTLFASGIASMPFANGISTMPFAALSPPNFVRQGPVVSPNMVVSPEVLSRARQNLVTLQSQVMYEDGFPVAVIVSEQEMPKATK